MAINEFVLDIDAGNRVAIEISSQFEFKIRDLISIKDLNGIVSASEGGITVSDSEGERRITVAIKSSFEIQSLKLLKRKRGSRCNSYERITLVDITNFTKTGVGNCGNSVRKSLVILSSAWRVRKT